MLDESVCRLGASGLFCRFGLNNIYFEKLSHTNLQTEQSGFGRKLQACKDHLHFCRFILCLMKNPVSKQCRP